MASDYVEDLQYLAGIQQDRSQNLAAENEQLRQQLTAANARVEELEREIERYKKLVRTGVRSLSRLDESFRHPGDDPPIMRGVTWGKVAWVFGLGSTSAHALCRECEVEPEHDAGKASD